MIAVRTPPSPNGPKLDLPTEIHTEPAAGQTDLSTRIAFYFIALVCAGIGIWIWIWISLPLSSALEIGTDESAEFTKAYLWSQGIPLYSVVWNNQPPLYTALLGVLFKWFGGTACVARAGAVWFGMSLLAALFSVVMQRSGRVAGFVAVGCLAMAPHTLTLGVSAMLEVPAIGTALWSLWLVRRGCPGRRALWLVLSGVLLGVALQIKLTAAVVGPALFAEVAVLASGTNRRERARRVCADAALVIAGALASFLIITQTLGGSYELMWAFFFSPDLEAYSRQHAEYQFSFQSLVVHREGLIGALVGFLLIVTGNGWRPTTAPLVLFSTALAIHFLHRPWWWYYYLHFAVPLAWLTGVAVAQLIQSIRTSCQGRGADYIWTAIRSILVLSTITWQITDVGLRRLVRKWDDIRHLPLAGDDMIVAKMIEYRQGTKWVYAKDTIYPFHAGLNVIPELAVLARNRFWSRGISENEIGRIIFRYRPEQVLIHISEHALQESLNSEYDIVFSNQIHRLYVKRQKIEPVRYE